MKSNENINFVKSNAPYPPIKVSSKNKHYANLLKEDYMGLVSEMTAVCQYMYHHFLINDIDKEISEMLEKIAIVEMDHLNILAQLIILLGEKPIYYSKDGFWNGSYVSYGYNILDQLESDLEAEYMAIDNYTKHIKMIDDPYIKTILHRIILDEEAHVQFFKNSIEKIKNKRLFNNFL